MFQVTNFVTKMQANPWYALFMLLLALTGLSLLLYEFTPLAQPEIVAVTMKIDLVIAYIFLSDFFLGLLFNQKYTRSEYWRRNWLDFISSIPISADMARALRILRVFRALRVISAAMDVYFTRRRYRLLKK